MNNQRPVTIFDPIHDSVREVLAQRYLLPSSITYILILFRLPEYSTTKQCTIFAGTWNLNGRVGCLITFRIFSYF